MENLIGPHEQAAIASAAPKSDHLVEVAEMPQYNTDSYKHVGLRAYENVTMGTTLLLEPPVAAVPVGRFIIHTNEKYASPSPESYVSEDKLRRFAQEKANYFKQHWPFVCPFLSPFHNQDYLQLVCILIRDRPDLAQLFAPPTGGPVEAPVVPVGTSGDTTSIGSPTGQYVSQRPPNVPAVTFEQFVGAMHSLTFFKVPRKQIAPWIQFENFQRLYDAVGANAYYSSTLVSEQKFALALFPLAARLNHSCRPNCMRLATPTGMYVVAICDIKAGDELTVSYIPTYIPEFVDLEVFQNNLKRNWGFSCRCNFCSQEGQDGQGRQETSSSERLEGILKDVPPEEFEIFGNVELISLMNDLNNVVRAQNNVGIMDKCEEIRAKFSDALESVPRLGYVISRHFVKLLQARQNIHVMDSILVDCIKLYPYWSTLYAKSIAAKCETQNIHFLTATFYQVIFYMISTNAMLRQAVRRTPKRSPPPTDSTIEKLETTAEAPTSTIEGREGGLAKTQEENDFLDAFFTHYLGLRQLATEILGSHWFLWTEFAMYFGLDVFIKEIEREGGTEVPP